MSFRSRDKLSMAVALIAASNMKIVKIQNIYTGFIIIIIMITIILLYVATLIGLVFFCFFFCDS